MKKSATDLFKELPQLSEKRSNSGVFNRYLKKAFFHFSDGMNFSLEKKNGGGSSIIMLLRYT